MITPAQLATIESRSAAATTIESFGPIPDEPDTFVLGAKGMLFCRVVGNPHQRAEPDATLFAHAKSDIETLLAAVRELREREARLMELVNAVQSGVGPVRDVTRPDGAGLMNWFDARAALSQGAAQP